MFCRYRQVRRHPDACRWRFCVGGDFSALVSLPCAGSVGSSLKVSSPKEMLNVGLFASKIPIKCGSQTKNLSLQRLEYFFRHNLPRKSVPFFTFEKTTAGFWSRAAPLLEEERDACRFASISQFGRP